MKAESSIAKTARCTRQAILASLILLGANSQAYELHLPRYEGNPGATVQVPVTLDDASGIAGIRAQVNFDPELVTVAAVTPGTLGSAFELDYETIDGQLFLSFSRGDALLSGAGTLAVISITLNPGAQAGLFSELALGDYSVCDELGVDLRLATNVAANSGRITVSLSGMIDNDRDGIPDAWEEANGLLPFEHDSLTTTASEVPYLLVYAFGLSPQDALAGLPVVDITSLAVDTDPPDDYLTVSFRRLLNPGTVSYHVDLSSELENWSESAIEVESFDNLDGTETVVFRDNLPVGSLDRRSIRLRIKSE